MSKEVILAEAVRAYQAFRDAKYDPFGIENRGLVNWRYMTPEEFQKHGGGLCWDYTTAMAAWLKANGITGWDAYIIYKNDQYGMGHSIIVFYDGPGYWYMPEPSFNRLRGIWRIKGPGDALNLMRDAMGLPRHEKDGEPPHVRAVKYNPLTPGLGGMTVQEFYSYLNHLEEVHDWRQRFYQAELLLDDRRPYTPHLRMNGT